MKTATFFPIPGHDAHQNPEEIPKKTTPSLASSDYKDNNLNLFNMKKFTLVLSMLLLMAASSWAAAVINVPGDQATIQAAINAASSGSVINVAAGTYTEAITIPAGKVLTIIGANAGIAAGNNPGLRLPETYITGGFIVYSASTIDGVFIQQGRLSGGFKVGVAVAASGVTITNCIIKDVGVMPATVAQSDGVSTQPGNNNLTLTNTTIQNNWRGIYFNPGSGHILTGNLIDANNGVGVGIGSDGLSNFTMTGNTISNHTVEGWGASTVGANVVAENNSFLNNGVSVAHYGGSAIDASPNYWNGTPTSPGTVSANVTYDPWWSDATMTTLASNMTVINVTNDPDTYYPTITAAITAAAAGDVIVAGAATYTENVVIDKNLTLQGPNYLLKGNDPLRNSEAIISGRVTISGQIVVFEGFTIQPTGSLNAIVESGNANTLSSDIMISNNILDGTNTTGQAIVNGGANGQHEYVGNLIRNFTATKWMVFFDGSNTSSIYFRHNELTNMYSGVIFSGSMANSIGLVTQNIFNINTWPAIALGASDKLIQYNLFTKGYIYVTGNASNPAMNYGMNNQILNNTFTGTTSTCVYFDNLPHSGNQVHNNAFLKTGTSAFVNNAHAGSTVDASCNWWGTATPPFQTSGLVSTCPYLTDGTDGDLNAQGFQPTGLCSGGAVAYNATMDPDKYYCSIPDAIADATAGDEVHILPGTHAGHFTIPKNLVLRGAGFGVDARTRSITETVINGTFGIGAGVANVTIDGFKFKANSGANELGIGGPYHSGIYGTVAGTVVIQNNILEGASQNNGPSTNPGLVYVTGTTMTFLQNKVDQITACGLNTNAVYLVVPAGGTGNIDNNTFAAGLGVGANTGSTVAVTNNTITNSYAEGIFFWPSAGATLTVTGNTVNTFGACPGGPFSALKVVDKPASLNGKTLTLEMMDELDIDNPSIASIKFDWMVGCVHNVTQDLFYADIQPAINAAAAGDVITVCAGTYNAPINIDKPLTLLGPNYNISPITGVRVPEAIITGNIDGVINLGGSKAAITIGKKKTTEQTPFTTISGVTIKGFKMTDIYSASNNAGRSCIGGGHNFVNYSQANNVLIENMLIDNNDAIGIYTNGHIILDGWRIVNNKISNLTFANASAINPWKQTELLIHGNDISNIAFGGINVSDVNTGIISGNIISNVGANGIQIAYNSTYTTSNITLTQNTIDIANTSSTPDYGGIRLYGGTQISGYCNVFENKVTNSFNGIAVKDGAVLPAGVYDVYSNSLTGNANREIYHGGTGTLDAECNWFGYNYYPQFQAKIQGPVDVAPFLIEDAAGVTHTWSGTSTYSCNGGIYTVTDYLGNYKATYPTIAAAIAAALPTDRVLVPSGVYNESVYVNNPGVQLAPGSSPGCITINSLSYATMTPPGVLEIEIDGLNPCTEHDQVTVTVSVDLTNATLTLVNASSNVYSLGSSITIIDNQGANPVTGTFTNGPSFFDGTNYWMINYAGGTGNDVTLTVEAAPTIVCPDDINLFVAPNSCTRQLLFSSVPASPPVVTGTPTPVLTFVLSGATLGNGTGYGDYVVFNLGVTTVTLTATNIHGTATCSFTVTVIDNEAPVLQNTCPTSFSVNNEPGLCTRVLVPGVDFIVPVYSETCTPPVTLTNNLPTGNIFPVGTTTVTYTATDQALNTHTCTFDVIVLDIEDPVITCPTLDPSYDTDLDQCYATLNFIATATDNCGIDNIKYYVGVTPVEITFPYLFPIGSTTVTAVATDVNGRTDDCTFDVVVEDNQDPAITCTSGKEVSRDIGVCTYTHSGTAWDATGSDNCPLPLSPYGYVLSGATSGSGTSLDGQVFNFGSTLVTWTITDASGNTNTCAFNVAVLNPPAPYGIATLSTIDDISTITNTPVVIAQTAVYTSPITTPATVLVDALFETSVAFPAGAVVEKITYDDGVNPPATFNVNFTGFDGSLTSFYLSEILGVTASPLNGHAGLSIDWTFTVSGFAAPYTGTVTISPIAYETKGTCESVIGTPVGFDLTFADLLQAALTPNPAQVMCDAVAFDFVIQYPAITNIDNGTGVIKNNAVLTSNLALPASTLNWSYNGNPGTPYSIIAGTTAILFSDITGLTAPLQGHGGLTDNWEFTLSGADLDAADYTFTIENIAQLNPIYIYNTSTVDVKGLPVITVAPMNDISTITHTPVIVAATITYPATISALSTVLTDALLESDAAFPATAVVESVTYDQGSGIATFPVNFSLSGLTEVYLSDILGTAAPLNGHAGLTIDWTFTLSGFDAAAAYAITVTPVAYIDKSVCESVIGNVQTFSLTFADVLANLSPDPAQIMCDAVAFDFDITYPAISNIDNGTLVIKNNAILKSDVALPASTLTWSYNGNPGTPYSVIAGTTNILLSDVTGMTAPLQGHGGLTDNWEFTLTGVGLAANDYIFTVENIAQLNPNYIYNTSTTNVSGLPVVTIAPIANISTITSTPVILPVNVTYPATISTLPGVYTDARISTTDVGGFPSGARIFKITYEGTTVYTGSFDLTALSQVFLSDILGAPAPTSLAGHAGLDIDWEIFIDGITSPVVVNTKLEAVAYYDKSICYSVLGEQSFTATYADVIVSPIADITACWPNDISYSYTIQYPLVANVGGNRVLNDSKITFWADAGLTVPVSLPSGSKIQVLTPIGNTKISTLTVDAHTVYGSAIVAQEGDLTTNAEGYLLPLTRPAGTDNWTITIIGAPAGTLYVKWENIALLDAAGTSYNPPLGTHGSFTEYVYDDQDFKVNYVGAAGVTMSSIPDISTITFTPVIIPINVTYPDLSLQNIDPSVLTDAIISYDGVGTFPAGARIFDITYNGTSVLGLPVAVGGQSSVLLSTILGTAPTSLLGHSGLSIDWEIYVDGIIAPVVIPVKVEAIAYLNYATCYSVMDDDQVTVTFADAVLAITETDITVCNTDPLKFSVAITYPAIVNVDADVKADAIITSNGAFPVGTVINWSYNGGAMTPYTLGSATTSILLSQIVGMTPPSLQGHSGTATWAFEITNAGIPSLYTIIIDPIALLDPVTYPYETGSVTLTVNPLPLVTAVDLQVGNSPTGPWSSVSGDLAAGYVQCIDPAVPGNFHYLDINTLTNTSYPLASATFEQNAFRITSAPGGFLAYWAAKGVDGINNAGGWELQMYDIINGIDPMFYIKYDGTDYSLIDGLQYQASGGSVANPLRINGDYLEGDYTFTGTVTDINGCVSLPFDVDIKFNSVPVITCASLTVNNDLNQCGASVDFSSFNVSATGVPTPYFTYDVAGVTITTGHFFPVGTTVVTATATNSCGSVSCNFDMIVVDNEAPRVTGTVHEDLVQYDACFIDATTPPLPSLAFNQTNALMGYGDNCPEPIVAVLTNTLVTGGHCGWVLTYTYNVMDSKGNSITSQTYSHIGKDQTPPALAGTADCSSLNISGVDECLSTAATWDATQLETAVAALYADACGTTVTATLIGTVPGAANTDCNWIFTYTYEIEDVCGNNVTCEVSRSGGDKTAPVITTSGFLPGSKVTLYSTNSGCESDYNWPVPPVSDNCDISVTPPVLLVSGNNSSSFKPIMGGYQPATFQLGTTIVTYAATDKCNNVSTATFEVEVIDTVKPVITGLPPTLTVNNDPGQCRATVVWPAPTITDNCTGVTFSVTRSDGVLSTNVNFNIFPVGITTVTYTATDASNNVRVGSMVVTVLDNEPIQLVGTIPGGAVGNVCIANAPVAPTEASIAALYTDNCGPIVATLISSSVTGNDCAWTATYTYEIHNSHGQYAPNAVVVYTGGDTEAPTVTTAAGALDATLQCSDLSGIAAALALYPAATDNCAATLTMHLVSDVTTPDVSCPNAYVRVRTWNFEDACTNVSLNFVQTITVIDDTKPVVTTGTGTLDGTYECSDLGGIAAALALYPAATDNCTATPTIHLVSDITTPDPGCANAYVRVRTWNFTDGCGNTSDDFVQTITVEDNTPPVVTTPAGDLDRLLQCDDATGIADALALAPAATDNCTVTPTIHLLSDVTTPDAYCPSAYVQVRTWNFSDGCGNTSTVFVQTITVIDNTAPTFTVPGPFTIYKDASCGYNADPSITGYPIDIDDNCDPAPGVQYVDVVTPGSCTGEEIITRTWYVTDNCGNSSSAVQVITAEDDTDPVLVGVPADVTVNCHEVPALPTVTATDNCDPAAYVVFGAVSTQDPDPTECGHYSYTITRTWTAYDNCGNSSTASQVITVIDVTKPVITGPADAIIYKDATCGYIADPSVTGSATATDNCATGYVVIDYADVSSTGSCVGETIITRTWTAEDPCGNVSSTIQIITVMDNIDPVLVGVPADVTVNCDAVPAVALVTATDNCDPAPVVTLNEVSTQGTDPAFCSFYNYTITRTWTAVDDCGNSSTEVQVVTVEDVTKPVITGPADIIIYKDPTCGYNADPMVTGMATATDNCAATPYIVIDYADVSYTGSCMGETIIERTWTAKDPCGNVSSTLQIITVEDNILPTITCATTDPDYLMNNGCYYEATMGEFDPVAVADNCYIASVTHDYIGAPSTTTLDGAMFPLGVTVVRWTVVDGCGNSAFCDITITVRGYTLSGNISYYNVPETVMDGVTITFTGPSTYTTTTDINGDYLIEDVVCLGTYNVTFATTKTAGGINSTDALQVNNYGVAPTSIEKTRWLAGDVGVDNFVDGFDASDILNYFITAGSSGFYRAPWSFHNAGAMITGSTSLPVDPGIPQVTVIGTQTEDFLALSTGDFNRSFVPGSSKSGGSVILTNDNPVKAEAGEVIEVPVTAGFNMEVGAASLILNYPADKVDILGVTLGEGNDAVMYNATNGTLRIGWTDLIPVNLTTGEALFTLKLRATSALTKGEKVTFTLAGDPLVELAEANGMVIPDATLNISTIESTVGVTEVPADANIGLVNYPNPFNSVTTFAYNIPTDGKVILEIHDLLGRKAAELVNENQVAGSYTYTMDTRDLLPGVYTATLRLQTDKATLVRTVKIVSQK